MSLACGERVLLPPCAKRRHTTLIIADGFSCREQIVQLTGRKPVHTAEVVRMAIGRGEETALERGQGARQG